jgi:hypothetical protein
MYRLLLILIACLAVGSAFAKNSPLEGRWQLNLEESDKVAISYKDGSGTGRRNLMQGANVSLGGLPLPSMGRIPSQSSMAPKNPSVLMCNTMVIETSEQRLTLTYDADDKEVMRLGDYRGRSSQWGRKGIKQTYKTPDRKVTKTWSMREDGRLLVEVKLDPPRDRARIYRRVFDRVPEPDPEG